MALTYRPDSDLEFLSTAREDDMRTLARYLTHDKDGSPRLSESLLSEAAFTKLNGDPRQYSKSWKLIAAELQHFGGDTAINLFRGTGVLYTEIARDVADHFDIKNLKSLSVKEVEFAILSKVLEDAWGKMDSKERGEALDSIGLKLAPGATMAAVQVAIKASGFGAYQMAAVVANAVSRTLLGKGLTFATTGTMMRSISLLAGPVGWAISAALMLPALTGPAYRVTVPAVLHLAYMRLAAEQGNVG